MRDLHRHPSIGGGPAGVWGAYEDHGLIFCTHRGRPLGWRNVTREFKKYLRAAELRDIRFHDLRHTNATLLLAAGIHPKIVQERLGHSNIRMTIDTYSHLIASMGRAAAEQLDALFA